MFGKFRFELVCALCIGVLPVVPPATARAVAVDLELVLAVDVSRSMDADEQQVQRDGYVAAITHPEVLEAIRSGRYRRVAVAYVEWAGPSTTIMTVPWQIVDDESSAAAFASALTGTSTIRMPMTSFSGVLQFASRLFDGNGFEGDRRVIDISGDGPNNTGDPVEPTRDRVVGLGITINGLPLLIRPSIIAAVHGADLADYYRDCVVGGFGAFVMPVDNLEQFAPAIRRKMVLEIAGRPAVPRPSVIPVASAKVDCFIGEEQRRRWSDW